MEKRALVFDNGSGFFKAGFAGENNPKTVFNTMIGKHKVNDSNFIGADIEKTGLLRFTYPMKHGLITNWNDMEAIWKHAFYNELSVEPSNHPILLTNVSLKSNVNRDQMVEIFFEKFHTPALYVVMQPVLSLYSLGRITGVVTESGDGVTQTVPIYHGYVIPHATQSFDLGGKDLTDYLATILTERGYRFNTTKEKEIVRKIKEELCFVSSDFEKDIALKESSFEKSYSLPDHRVIKIGKEQFRCPEAIFSPLLLGKEMAGIHEQTYSSILKVKKDIHKELFANVILSGGNTLFSGTMDRMMKELSALTSFKIRIIRPETKFSAWTGGSVLASMSTFKSMWITKKEYFESGKSIIRKKCF